MKKIVAIIERGDDGGFAIYSDDVKGLVGTGITEDEAKIYLRKSYIDSDRPRPEVQNIKLENILSIGGAA